MGLDFIKKFYFPEQVLNFLKSPMFDLNEHIDNWLLVHFISGGILAFIFGPNKLILVLLLLIGYEFLEKYMQRKDLTTYESPYNIILDVLFGLIGYTVTVESFF